MDPMIFDDFRNTCLTFACKHNPSIEITKYLIEKIGMSVNIVDRDGNNLLSLACEDNSLNLDAIKYLIHCGLSDRN